MRFTLIAAAVLAQSVPDQVTPWLTALNLGLAGIGLWLFIKGRLHSDSEYRRIVAKLDAAEAELRLRNAEDRQTLIPALVRATDVLAAYLERRGDTPPPNRKVGA